MNSTPATFQRFFFFLGCYGFYGCQRRKLIYWWITFWFVKANQPGFQCMLLCMYNYLKSWRHYMMITDWLKFHCWLWGILFTFFIHLLWLLFQCWNINWLSHKHFSTLKVSRVVWNNYMIFQNALALFLWVTYVVIGASLKIMVIVTVKTW